MKLKIVEKKSGLTWGFRVWKCDILDGAASGLASLMVVVPFSGEFCLSSMKIVFRELFFAICPGDV